ncbi:MAG: cell division protein FtsA [Candidatus Omnitrophica bacterium]|nr:cell division protein FtsA [Candidatus Omnitrophota bacterium]
MENKNLITGIDLGSSKIAVAIGDCKDGEINLKSYEIEESVGIRGGVIVDLKAACECISRIIQKAEKNAKTEITSVFIGISGQHLHSNNNEGKISLSTDQEEIGVQHLKEVIFKAKTSPSSLGLEVLHVLPSEFILDNVAGVKNPIGLFGKELKVKLTSVIGITTAIQNAIRCVHLAGLDVEHVIANMIATGEAILYPEEKDLGVGLIDLGSHLTDIAIYKGEYPAYLSSLPYGGENLSREIATRLHVSLKEAEEIKKSHGVCLRYLLDNNEEINFGKPTAKKIRKLELVEIIEEKSEMLVSHIFARIGNYLPLLGSGIVLTGGTSNLVGLKEVIEQKMNLPVRIGGIRTDLIANPSIFQKPSESMEYATSLGLIAYGKRVRDKEKNFPWEKENIYDKTIGKVFNWIKNFF